MTGSIITIINILVTIISTSVIISTYVRAYGVRANIRNTYGIIVIITIRMISFICVIVVTVICIIAVHVNRSKVHRSIPGRIITIHVNGYHRSVDDDGIYFTLHGNGFHNLVCMSYVKHINLGWRHK
jgi:hypothetical protein